MTKSERLNKNYREPVSESVILLVIGIGQNCGIGTSLKVIIIIAAYHTA